MQSAPQSRDRLLLAAITGGRQDATLGFGASMLRLQTEILTNEALSVAVDVAFFDCLDDVLNSALKAGHDYVVAVDSYVSFSSAFVMRFMQSPYEVVAAPHPVPGAMDWDRIAKRPMGEAESIQFAGNIYAPSKPTRRLREDYWACSSVLEGTKKLMCVGIRRKAIEAAAAVVPFVDDRAALCFPRVEGERRYSADEAFLKAWGGELVLDLASPCSVLGPIAFQGAVTDKQSLR